ncbi:Variant surface glycoprotein [Trypanosoma congolense IL3000]|uniref:Variant surface glycoprotein n=1 Tax=Trypanosoma congolense (strain IL3000) TaxID=1068625 RepID=F9WJY6_TRYCI|nr:Variant surface glycoprotein [Trypanosoma congolense IL3000]
MWRNAIIVLVFFHYFVEAVNCHNEPERELLCNIFRQSERVLQEFAKAELIKEAIYGPMKENALIIKGEGVSLIPSCYRPILRNQFCEYLGSERVKDGCFAESLLGTFFCICVPGAQRGTVSNLCGVDIGRHFDLWHGTFPMRDDETEDIFGNVWRNVVGKCTGGSGNVESGSEELEKLRMAVEEVENKTRLGTNGFFYFGGSEEKGCGGSDGRNVCAAYLKKDGSVSKARIPWVEKIKKAITQLQEMKREKRSLDSREKTTGRNSESIVAPPHRTGEGNTELTVQSEGAGTPPNSDRTHSKTKISTKTSPITNIPHLATNLNEDGSLLTNQEWLVIAALLN